LIKTKKVEYTSGKTQAHGLLVWDDSVQGKRPGVVVFPEAFGLNDHARERAVRLAQSGYIALAADMNGAGVVYDDMAKLGPAIGGLYADRSEWRARARAALDTLIRRPNVDRARVASIGFCFGGTTAVELARTGAPVAVTAAFHAGLVPPLPEDTGRITGKVLVCHGAKDPLAKPEVIEAVRVELERDAVDWQFIYYGNAAHSFTDPAADGRGSPAFAYNKLAEQRSWASMLYVFQETFE
jgi:dienelactone hydrolase